MRRGRQDVFDVHAYRVHRDRLVGLCRLIVGDRDLAEGLADEAICRAIAKGVGLGDDARAWLNTVARNLAIDHVRHARFETGLPDRLDAEDPDATGELDNVVELVAHERARAVLAEALNALPVAEQRVLWLHDVQGLEYTEIAAIEGTTESASRNRASRVRRRVRNTIAAAVGELIGLGWALLPESLRRWLARHGSSPAPAAAASTIVLALGVFATVLPDRESGAGPMPGRLAIDFVDSVDAAPPDRGQVVGDGNRTPVRDDDDRTESGGLASLDVGVKRNGEAAVPKRGWLGIEIQDPEGRTVYWKQTDWGCERPRGSVLVDAGPAILTC